MSTGSDPRISEALPKETWDILKSDQTAVLIDVRTAAEWKFVGVPDLSELDQEVIFAEWVSFPGMTSNPQFVEDVLGHLGGDIPDTLLFLCRSGVRSLAAASAVLDALEAQGKTARCVNVLQGFEGDLDAQKHRGGHNGWQSCGLAWRQS